MAVVYPHTAQMKPVAVVRINTPQVGQRGRSDAAYAVALIGAVSGCPA